MANQVYGYDVWAEAKRTSDCELRITFLNSLPVGAAVYEERNEWDAGRNEVVMVVKQIGHVAAGEFGDNVFVRTARFYE